MKNQNLFEKLIRLKISFIIGWIIPAVYTITLFEPHIRSILYFIATELLMAHIIYGGYVIFQKQENIKIHNSLMAMIIWILTITLLPLTLNKPLLWFGSLQIIFMFAILFHLTSKNLTKKTELKKFCDYKINLEVGGVIFSITGVVLNLLFPENILIAVLNLIVIIYLNIKIFFLDKAYEKLSFVRSEK